MQTLYPHDPPHALSYVRVLLALSYAFFSLGVTDVIIKGAVWYANYYLAEKTELITYGFAEPLPEPPLSVAATFLIMKELSLSRLL